MECGILVHVFKSGVLSVQEPILKSLVTVF